MHIATQELQNGCILERGIAFEQGKGTSENILKQRKGRGVIVQGQRP